MVVHGRLAANLTRQCRLLLIGRPSFDDDLKGESAEALGLIRWLDGLSPIVRECWRQKTLETEGVIARSLADTSAYGINFRIAQ